MSASDNKLICTDTQHDYPLWLNNSHVSLVGMVNLILPDNDLEDDNPLPYGHLAFVEDDAQLWVCRAWYDGHELGQMVLQFSSDLGAFFALHDWQLKSTEECHLKKLLLALMATASPGFKVIAADEDMQTRLQQLLGGLSFDMHNCTRIFWTSHAESCCS